MVAALNRHWTGCKGGLWQTYLVLSGWQASALHHQLLRETLEARIKASEARLDALEKA